jgi:hypothetical protein
VIDHNTQHCASADVADRAASNSKGGRDCLQAADVVIASWGVPGPGEHNAQQIAIFLGAPVSLAPVAVEGGRVDGCESRSKCLVVSAQTLANIAATEAGISGVREFLGRADYVFIFGFRPVAPHTLLVRELSSGSLTGVEPFSGPQVTFNVSHASREWCGPFAGLTVGPLDGANRSMFIAGEQPCEVLIRAGVAPYFVRLALRGSQVFLVPSTEIADLDQAVPHEARLTPWFSDLAPLVMFLRGALGRRLWHNPQPRACFIIDDPLLKTRYGFLRFRELTEAMRDTNFALSLAFIPWNCSRSNQEIARIFSSSSHKYSLCVHGCDHSGAEFLSDDFGAVHGKAALALERMRKHERLAGAPFDSVMVFPQGLFSPQALRALKACGYLAAVNTDLCTSAESDTLTLRELLDVAVMRHANFPLFGRRYPRAVADFALDLLMGKPLLVVEHHGYFRDGYGPLRKFVEQLNAVDDRLEWTNLGVICSRSCLMRTTQDGQTQIRFYTDRFSFTNNTSKACDYVLLRRHADGEPLPVITVNGHERISEIDRDELTLRLSLEPAQTLEIQLMPCSPQGTPRYESPITYEANVLIRRVLSEVRDNYVDTSQVLSKIVFSARRSLSRAVRRAGARGRSYAA